MALRQSLTISNVGDPAGTGLCRRGFFWSTLTFHQIGIWVLATPSIISQFRRWNRAEKPPLRRAERDLAVVPGAACGGS